ncbi:GPXHA-2 [Symbiodinium sp. CCMP2592]|nr:GPXHA-2 [Symbiodinium sp. CCMP2592]
MARKRALAALALGVWSAGFVSPFGAARGISQARAAGTTKTHAYALSAWQADIEDQCDFERFGLSAALVLRHSVMVVAVPSGGPGGPCPAGCEVRAAAPPKGFGLFACSSCSAYTDMFTEEPLFAMQHSGNRRVVAACARCCGFVPSVPLQLEVLFGESRFAPLLTALGDLPSRWQENSGEGQASVVRCKQGCGELYCSEACRDMHFQHSHNLLCVGPLTTEDHPLLRFKYHALEHADTLLLAAQVFAFLINRAKAAGGGAEVTQGLMQELLCFCHAPFREACRPPPGRSKDAEFYVACFSSFKLLSVESCRHSAITDRGAHADGLVSEAAALLRAALEPHAPAEVGALFASGPNFFAEVLGLFEYNNIDLEVQSPVGPLLHNRAKALAPHISNPQAVAELKQLDALLREKEWVMRCIWGEETTGIFGDEADVAATNPATQDAEPMDSLMKAAEQGNDAEVASAAMAQATAEVARLSLEQLLQVQNIDGQEVSLQEYSGKVVLVVNLASKCVNCMESTDLEDSRSALQKIRSLTLPVLGFPCNQFGGQAFAQSKCPDTFPLFAKIDAPLYTFLKARQGELLGSDIKWNFAKFLVDRQGQPVARFGPQQASRPTESCIRVYPHNAGNYQRWLQP